MRRRALLATIGSALGAGCGGLTGGGGGSRRPDQVGPFKENLGGRPSINASEEEFNFSEYVSDVDDDEFDFDENGTEFDFNESEFDEDVEFDFGGPEIETPGERDPTATKHLNEAGRSLAAAYNSYLGAVTGARSLTDVTPTADSFASSSVVSKTDTANDSLRDAGRHATEGQQAIVKAMTQVSLFLGNMATVEEELVEAYDDFTFARDRLYNESYIRADQYIVKTREHVDRAQAAFEPIDSELDARSVTVFEPLSQTEFDRKVSQAGEAIDAFADFDNGLDSLRQGLEKLDDGVSAYVNERYRRAQTNLISAGARLGIGSSSFESVPEETGLKPAATDLFDVMRTLEQTSNAFERAVEARLENEQAAFHEAERAVREHVGSNDTVASFSFLTQWG